MVHPEAESVPTTEKEVVAAGLTEIELVVAALLHRKVSALLPESVSVCPTQITVLPVMVTFGKGLTETCWMALLVHPEAAIVPTTEKSVVEPGLTAIEFVVAELLQRNESALPALSMEV